MYEVIYIALYTFHTDVYYGRRKDAGQNTKWRLFAIHTLYYIV